MDNAQVAKPDSAGNEQRSADASLHVLEYQTVREQAARPVGVFVLVNLALFVVYTLVGMMFTWINVRAGQPYDRTSAVLWTVGTAILLTSLPVAWVVNWKLSPSGNQARRAAIGIGVGSLAFAVGLLPWQFVVMAFHLWIGGTL